MINKYSEGCYRMQGRSLSVDDIEVIKKDAEITQLRRARICMHYDQNDLIQQMIVMLMKDSYKGTYKYNKSASFMLMEGEMILAFFTEGGIRTDEIQVSASNPFVKIEAGVFHAPIILTPHVLLYETHLGPWGKDAFMTKAPYDFGKEWYRGG